MDNFELKISKTDWIYINILGSLFGLLLGVLLYFMDEKFQDISTITFGLFTGLSIGVFSSIFISISNNHILPNISKKYWYIISFGFSFFSGVFGYLFVYIIHSMLNLPFAYIIAPYSVNITFIIGLLTFLIGLILHLFISMKYKNESIKNEILHSKIKALENELNPHFLFNALNSMSELVYIDQKRAEDSILNLSKFLRSAIKTDSLISIDDELEMVKTYVDIENIRFEDKIKLHIENRSNKNIVVPKFSIQLLVENAIKHGYMDQGIEINIIIDKDIEVNNSGIKPKTISYGTGLSNLETRLRLLTQGKLESKIDDKIRFFIKVDDENSDS